LALAFRLRPTFGLLVGMPNDASAAWSVRERVDVVSLTNSILLPVDKVPSLGKVVFQILNNRAFEGNADVGPSHSAVELAVELVVLPVLHVLEVHDTSVVVVLPGEDDLIQISRVCVGDAVLVRVPSPITEIQTSHEGDVAINQTQFFVMGPVQDVAVYKIESADIGMEWEIQACN
jgi:hypothetical protein